MGQKLRLNDRPFPRRDGHIEFMVRNVAKIAKKGEMTDDIRVH